MLNRFAFALLATAISASPVEAQIRGTGAAAGAFGIAATPGTMGAGITATGASGFGIATGGFQGRGDLRGPARFHPHQGHASAPGAILLPYLSFYSDYGYDSQEAVQPQIVVMPGATATPPAEPPPPLESLMIEWQGDHFVRTTMSQKASGGQSTPDYSEKTSSQESQSQSTARAFVPGRRSAAEPPRELPPAVLVFRDGHKEEVSDYTIMSGTIYSKADYWTSGSWTKKIQIADLDVPATLRINQERGVKFMLPASPNEVVMRP